MANCLYLHRTIVRETAVPGGGGGGGGHLGIKGGAYVRYQN